MISTEETNDILLAALRAAQHEVETQKLLVDYWMGRANKAEAELGRDVARDPEWVGAHE
ncbi:hypothetical protein [uncultured Parolsenella sp.]|uniref:hypothetical protein n=1 Tax=uncultured Parolsenella sp. TaxID=2083008 RepID=UPI0025D35A4F|nr:hypothetical protein [uncultured Parolsenella sp.]